MLRQIGVASIEDLFKDIPPSVRFDRDLNLPLGLPEVSLERHVRGLAGKNKSLLDLVSFLGAGVYDRYIPSAIGEILRRAEFYTSYTPYQPEVSQGTLQVIWEFQSMVALLMELDVAQASLYDGATAAGEAALMAVAQTGRKKVLVPRAVDPQTRGVLRTYALGQDLEICEVPLQGDRTAVAAVRSALDDQTAALIIQQPNFLGSLEDARAMGEAAHAAGALFIVSADPISLAVLEAPGAYGADIAVAEGQSLGIAPSFGGPFLGLMAARQELVRKMPGRIVGATVDEKGDRGYVLTLQTREQHIRREKATSNICTNQGLMALAATVYLSLMGPQGLREAAELSLEGAHEAYEALLKLPGVRPLTAGPFFQEFAVLLPRPATAVNERLLEKGILGGYALAADYPELGEGAWLVCVTEKRTDEDIQALVRGVAEAL